jgi:hypothetical protein
MVRLSGEPSHKKNCTEMKIRVNISVSILTIFLLFLSYVPVIAEKNEITYNLSNLAIDSEGIGGNKYNSYNQNNFFGQELAFFLPLSYHKDIYQFGIGGSIIYENYAINRLFSSNTTIPGIFLGLSASFFIMGPVEEYNIDFGECSIINAGPYIGYQFLFPVSKNVDFKVALYTGMRYYISLHFFSQRLYVLYDPIFTAGFNISFIVDRFFILMIKAEYEFFIETTYVHSLQMSLGTGVLF